jgi:hypothetical protein
MNMLPTMSEKGDLQQNKQTTFGRMLTNITTIQYGLARFIGPVTNFIDIVPLTMLLLLVS